MYNISRRKFLNTAGLSFSALSLSSHTLMQRPSIKAIAFDAFPIFDPRPIFKNLVDRFPEKGKQLGDTWRAKQFGYQWLRASGGKYKNFWEVTRDALVYAAAETKIELSAGDIDGIMNGYKHLNVWPDVLPALEELKAMKLKLCFLSNMTEEMLQGGLQNAGALHYFDYVISTDKIKSFKPSPRAYQLGMDTLRLKKEEILFVPFAGWDMAGAVWFGYPTYWVNRAGSVKEELDAKANGVGKDLGELVGYLKV